MRDQVWPNPRMHCTAVSETKQPREKGHGRISTERRCSSVRPASCRTSYGENIIAEKDIATSAEPVELLDHQRGHEGGKVISLEAERVTRVKLPAI